ncbi:transposase IS116/IS110/IS902 family protein [Larkinella arboricola]|uniref:Transposase IS116/IS110/IS902 family protein n=1 Tax=Larkinella arboricola TaxID=643671 RepID=A0A327WGC7_LARAB|nr:transposase [Larkinella arboricola]RAJ90017.1 transposase IS116/IS110/IS902 family protein [Larkinella arboricola]
MIDSFERAIIDLQQEVCQLCEAEYHEQYQGLLSIKGISHKVATALLEATNGFQAFQSAKAVAKFIGLAPTTFQSGKMSTHRGICRTGDSHLRGLLYVASCGAARRSAIRCNRACREFYQRLKAAGKPSKLALIAVANNGAARRLLRQAFALVRFGENFNDNYQPKFRAAPCI